MLMALTLFLAITSTTQAAFSQASTCAGDCNDDGVVRIDEVIRLVGAVQAIGCPIAPNCPPPDPCLGLDINGDGEISTSELVAGINRVVQAVGYGLNGCPTRAVSRAGRRPAYERLLAQRRPKA
jgi:hypothetical protein